MPRIDPVQLLNCLSVLLSPNGGIKSTEEVQRLASLMTKYSKKLVSKCIYILILKCTETELLGLFMGSGGWRLIHTWLTESIVAKNWPLVRELLELLLLCPVDIERLKTNNCPKLVKELSKDGNHFAIRALASKLVEQWLKSVKGEHVVPLLVTDIPQIVANAQLEINVDTNFKSDVNLEAEVVDKKLEIESKSLVDITKSGTDSNKEELIVKEDINKDLETLPVLKISVKDGKQVISQVDDGGNKSPEQPNEKEKCKEKHRSKSKDKTYDKSSSKSSSSSKHSSKSHSSNDKDKSSHKSSNSSRHSSKDKSSRDKEKHSSHSSRSKQNESSNKKSDKTSSSKSKDDKNAKLSVDKSKDKNKDEKSSKSSIEKIDDKTTPSIHKLGKIPKLSDAKKEKPSISIEVRKPDEPKPKTVKTFHSKFRKHGLEEEVKPPPSRAALLNKKVPLVLPPTIPVPKRPSPVHSETPPEKKPKTIEPVEKPGAIKLIPPKPKRAPSPKLLVLSSSVKYSLKV